MNLLDRTRELERLRLLWRDVVSGTPRLFIIYGLRQIGKTYLITYFLKEGASGAPLGRTLYFSALPNASEQEQLQGFAEATRGLDRPPTTRPLITWRDALDLLAAMARSEPLAVVLDEVPWLVESSPTLPGMLQQLWDSIRRDEQPPRLLLVLTGSAIGTMRRLIDATGALFGRADGEMHLRTFDLPTTAQALPGCSPAQAIEAYSACGGYPRHLSRWDVYASTNTNLLQLAASPGAILTLSGERLLADVPTEGGHRRVLHAIGTGSHRRSEIGSMAGQRVDRPLDLLLRTTLVRHQRPLGSSERAAGRYELADPYLRFWYEMVWGAQDLIESGQGAAVLRRRLPRWQRHLGWVFEELAREHAVRLALKGDLPTEAVYGEWWAPSGPQVQLDVIGLVGKRTVLAGEAKWTENPVGARELADLQRRAGGAPDPLPNPLLVYWSRGSLDPALRSPTVRAYGPEEMVSGD